MSKAGPLSRSEPPTVLTYGAAVATVVAVLAAGLLLQRFFEIAPVVSLLLCGVLFAAWFGGLGPGLLAVALSVLAFSYFFLPPFHSAAVRYNDVLRVALFAVAALFVVALSAKQRGTAQSLRRARDDLQAMVRELEKVNASLRIENAERRRADAKLDETQQELQQTIDMIPGIVTCYRPDGERDFVNKPWRDYAGLTLSDIQGEGWRKIIHPDDAEESLRKWRISLATGEPFEFEHRLRRADGEWRWHMIRRVALRAASGEILRWYGIGFDIEEQKRAEAALRQSEARLVEAQRELQATIDTIPALASRYRADGTTDFVNQTWRNYTGLSQESWTGRGSAVVHPDDRERVEQAWAAHLAAAEPFDVEQRMRRADGEYRWYFVRRVPLRDDSGNVIAWYGAGYDIEDRKRAELALRAREAELAEAQRELQATVDTIPVVVARFLPDGSNVFLNKIGRDFTGLSEEDVSRGQRAFHPDDRERIQAEWRACLDRGEPFQTELRVRRRDGVYRWFATRRAPLRDKNGQVVKWYSASFDIEDRKRAEFALRAREAELAEAQRELRATIDTIPILVASYSTDGKRDFVNAAWKQYTGLSDAAALGTEWSITVHPDDVADGDRKWRAALARGESLHIEQRFRRADGHYRWHAVDRVALHDGQGKVIKWYSVSYDIEDRKRAELALRAREAELAEAQRELQLTLDRIPTLAWQTRSDGFAEYLNKRWLDYTGLSIEQALGWDWQIVVHPDDLSGLLVVWRRMLASGNAEEVEARMRRFDGEYRWFLFRPASLRDEAGNVLRWYGTNTDIEDRKRAEDALRRSEAYLAEAQRLSVTGSFGWRIPSNVIIWSKETYRIFDVDFVAEPTLDLVLQRTHPDDVERIQRLIERMANEDRDFDFEHRLLLPGGAIKHLHVRTHRIRFETREVEIVGAVMDVTAARKAEEALRRAQTELAHANRVATLGELSASIAHEVNQPLTGIVTNGEAAIRWLSRELPEKEHAVRAVTRLINEAHRAGQVIRRIRDLSKKAEPEMSQIDINSLVEEVVRLVHVEAFGQLVSVRPQLASGLPPVRGDKIQVQQVLINLVMNGIQAMAPITGRARILAIRTEQRGADQVLVAVEDVGVGIEPENLDRLFGAFYTTKPDGMGMGLSISRSIVEAHGGRVWATRNPGPGMTFQFTLSAHREGTPGSIPAREENAAGGRD
jgi:PAS domain S-box-containing protein